MIEIVSKLAELAPLQLALLALIAALGLVARTVHRRRSLRPPGDTSLPPKPAEPSRCNGCRRRDRGETGWVRARGVVLCPVCALASYDGQ